MRSLILLIFILCITPIVASAANPADINCSDSSTFCANSASLDHVQASVDECINNGGGTVFIPEGTMTWDGSLSVHTGPGKMIRLIGAGQDLTKITDMTIDVPSNGSNLVELAHLTIIGSGKSRLIQEKFRPKDNPCSTSNELRFHHLTMTNYGTILTFEGWYGSVDNNTIKIRDGKYGFYVHHCANYDSEDLALETFGSRNALFFENNTFDNGYHVVSGFCNSKIVFRYNTISGTTHCVDVHGPGYNGCYYADPQWRQHGGRVFEHYHNTYESSAKCGAKIRSGTGLSTNNTYEMTIDENSTNFSYFGLKIDGGSASGGCGDGAKVLDYPCSDGICEGPQQYWIWDENHIAGGSVMTNLTDYDDCNGMLKENETYFLRAPNQNADGLDWQPFTYPHPLADGDPVQRPVAPKNLRLESQID